MAEVTWIKIAINMFGNRKIKILRKLPQGDSIALIWIMLLTMAGRCNEGGKIFFDENIPYTPKMLAIELEQEESLVQTALRLLCQLNMITIQPDDTISINCWTEHQNIEGMERIREQNRNRQKRWADNQKALLNTDILPNVIPNVSIALPNATDIDKEKELERDKQKEIYIVGQQSDPPSLAKQVADTPQSNDHILCTSVISYLNEKAGTNYKSSTAKTRSIIQARVKEGFSEQDFKTVIDKKCADWIGTNYQKYLRPETLFGTKFEGYLNEKRSAGGLPKGTGVREQGTGVREQGTGGRYQGTGVRDQGIGVRDQGTGVRSDGGINEENKNLWDATGLLF